MRSLSDVPSFSQLIPRFDCLENIDTTMSDDVSQFLQQVQQLQGRRVEEDEARSRELEEKILQEKSERAARRAGK